MPTEKTPHITKLWLENFKSHKSSVIEFGMVTSIVPLERGRPNDVGKTNILKGLDMLLQHKNFPADWIMWGADGPSEVGISLKNGAVLKRTRKGRNQGTYVEIPGQEPYDGDGKKDALQMVLQATGIKKVKLDEAGEPEDLNIVPSRAPRFIYGRPESVYRKLIGAVGGNAIERARIELAEELKKLRTDSERISEEAQQVSQSSEFWARQAHFLTERLQPIEAMLAQAAETRKALEAIEKLQSEKPPSEWIFSIEKASQLYSAASHALQEAHSVNKALEAAASLRDARQVKRIPAQLEARELDDAASALALANGLLEAIEQKVSAQKRLDTLEEERKERAARFEEALKALGVCPLCGQETA